MTESHNSHFHIETLQEGREARNPWTSLWRAVVFFVLKDLVGEDAFFRSKSLKWIKSRDFYMVCDFANIDPDYLLRIMYEIAIQHGARQKYILQQVSPWLLSEATNDWDVPEVGSLKPRKIRVSTL